MRHAVLPAVAGGAKHCSMIPIIRAELTALQARYPSR